jgi:hypothetical protein
MQRPALIFSLLIVLGAVSGELSELGRRDTCSVAKLPPPYAKPA